MNLERFTAKCYDIYARGDLRDFARNERRQVYFDAWRRALRLRTGPEFSTLKDHREMARARANWEAYCARERRMGNGENT